MSAKGWTSRDILERLTESAAESAYLALAIITAGYGASSGKINKRAEEVRQQLASPISPDLSTREKHNFNVLLSRMKKDGLIERKSEKWAITPKGRGKLSLWRNRPRAPQYLGEDSNNLRIIAFDIPEKERGKRAWLRSALKNMGFKMVQQSIWAGKRNIPKQFLKDLQGLKIIQHVDIFTVTKSGSLRSLRI